MTHQPGVYVPLRALFLVYQAFTGISVQCNHKLLFEPHHKKTCLQGFNQVWLKPGCTATEDG